jgi:hypothetical protein
MRKLKGRSQGVGVGSFDIEKYIYLARSPTIKITKIIADIKRISHIFKRLISWFS